MVDSSSVPEYIAYQHSQLLLVLLERTKRIHANEQSSEIVCRRGHVREEAAMHKFDFVWFRKIRLQSCSRLEAIRSAEEN